MIPNDPTKPEAAQESRSTMWIRIEVPSDAYSNEIQLMAALEQATDILMDKEQPDALNIRRRVGQWYADRTSK